MRDDQERLRKRLGELLKRERAGAAAEGTASGKEAAASGKENATGGEVPPPLARDRAQLDGLLPGREATTPFGNLHIYEAMRGPHERGYGRLLAKLADAGQRLELLPEAGLDPDFANVKRCGIEGLLLLDLETAGLAGNPVFLAGLLTIHPDRLHLRQFLARSYLEEPALLAEVSSIVRSRPVLVSYNGKSFDLPMLSDRACRHGIHWAQPASHLDLLHHARRAYRGRTPDCRLVTLEWLVCQRRRLGDVAGREIPGRFHRFAREGDPTAILPILHHNALDLVTLAELLAHLIPHPPGLRFVPDDEFDADPPADGTETRLGHGVG